MDSSKEIIAVAIRYGIVMQHVFSDLYSAVLFLKKGEREGKHLSLGAFDSVSGVVYTLENGNSSQILLKERLKSFLDLGLNASRIVVY